MFNFKYNPYVIHIFWVLFLMWISTHTHKTLTAGLRFATLPINPLEFCYCMVHCYTSTTSVAASAFSKWQDWSLLMFAIVTHLTTDSVFFFCFPAKRRRSWMLIKTDCSVCSKVMTHSTVKSEQKLCGVFLHVNAAWINLFNWNLSRHLFKATSHFRSFADSFLSGHTNRAFTR